MTSHAPAQRTAAAVAARPKRFRSIQQFRAIAVLMVLVAHTAAAITKYGAHHSETLRAMSWVGSTGVLLFFIISGFVICEVAQDGQKGWRGASKFLYRRFVRIYPIYWIYTLIVLAVYLLKPEIVDTSNTAPISLFASFTLIPVSMSLLVAQGWSLVYELIFYGVFAILILLCRKRAALYGALGLWLVLVLGVRWTQHPPPGVASMAVAIVVLPFLLGCGVSVAVRRMQFALGAGIGMMAAAVLGTVVTFFELPRFGVPRASADEAMPLGVSYALLILGALVVERWRPEIRSQLLEGIGDWSYSIYLSHVLVLSAIMRAAWLAGFPMGNPFGVAAMSLFVYAMCVAWGRVSFEYLERPMLNWTGARVKSWGW